jgi:hypothetical protein
MTLPIHQVTQLYAIRRWEERLVASLGREATDAEVAEAVNADRAGQPKERANATNPNIAHDMTPERVRQIRRVRQEARSLPDRPSPQQLAMRAAADACALIKSSRTGLTEQADQQLPRVQKAKPAQTLR